MMLNSLLEHKRHVCPSQMESQVPSIFIFFFFVIVLVSVLVL